MFVEKFLIVDRKWASTFCDNWIMQKKTIEKNVHFEKTIREYENAAKKRLKIVEHVNVVILQNQSQSQSKKSTSSICSDQHEDNDKTRQCIWEYMHDWNKCDHIRKSIRSSNWKCNSQEKKWTTEAIKNNRWLYFKIKNMTNTDILDEIKPVDHKKKTLLSVFKDLINQCDRIEFNERAIVCIIRTDQETFINKKLEDWVRAQDINWDWSTKNTFKQNEKSERFDELLIEKTRCIKEHAKLSKDFYSECYLVAAHILNRTSSSTLSWDSSLIFMQKLLKKSIRNEIAHLKVFDCKAFSLFKKTDALKKNEKMKFRAFIEYLIKYDFINIFRVWNSKKDDVNDYRDVIFNKTKFFDTYEAIDFFKKEEKKFYVTYRVISLQIFENNVEK
jgi:hypothetical protein